MSERVEEARREAFAMMTHDCGYCDTIPNDTHERERNTLDALILAVRADERARMRGIVEGMRSAYPPSLEREATLDAVLYHLPQ